MRILMTAFMAMLIATAPIAVANAQGPCQDRRAVLDKLAKDFDEAPVAIGMAANGGVLEVLAASADKNSFTIIVTMPNGMACMLASGKHFEMLDAVTTVKGDPA